jgi:hypothetical protein
MEIVNWGIVKHPLNWGTVVMMLVIAAMAGTLILTGVGLAPATANSGQ